MERANRGIVAARPGFNSNSGHLLLLRFGKSEDGAAPSSGYAVSSLSVCVNSSSENPELHSPELRAGTVWAGPRKCRWRRRIGGSILSVST